MEASLTTHTILDTIVTIVVTVLASSGFWALLEARARRREKVDEHRKLQTDLLLGLAHDRILYLGLKYIERGYVTPEEYENLKCYLYDPYKGMDGNGSAGKIMDQVDLLPIDTKIK